MDSLNNAFAIEASRRELLDLGLRNPLLNYRPSKARGMKVTDEVSEEIYRILVVEGNPMTFLPAPDTDTEEETSTALETMGQPEDSGERAARHTDTRLQTELSSAKLQAALVKTGRAARTFVEEQGVNVLYLALGMLRWYEDENSSQARSAPLILIPVQLDRASVQERFRLVYSGDEIVENLSLVEKLRIEFDLRLPELPEAGDLVVGEYLSAVAASVERESRWAVDENAIALDLFSFGKLLMYLDLDPERWPDKHGPSAHPLIKTLLGQDAASQPAPEISDDEHLDAYLSPGEVWHVVDADSSQSLAIMDARAGQNLVIQGPPGTGKSQTITNLIAAAVADGKRVLFVSEKMAALEVVKRRLDSVGVGDACLELHSKKTKKAEVLRELGRTLALGRPEVRGDDGELELFVDLRDRLNDYADAVNREIGRSGVTPYRAVGELSRLERGERDAPRADFAEMEAWSLADFRRRELLVERLQEAVSGPVSPAENAFLRSGLTVLLPTSEGSLRASIYRALDGVRTVRRVASELAGTFGAATPDDPAECRALIQGARAIEDAPDTQGLAVEDKRWPGCEARAMVCVDAGLTRARLVDEHTGRLIPEAWEQDLLSMRTVYVSNDSGLKRLFSRQFRSERDRLRGLCTAELPQTYEEQLALIEAVLAYRRAGETIRESQTLCEELFGERIDAVTWNGGTEDWERLGSDLRWVANFRREVVEGHIPPEAVSFLAEGRDGTRETLAARCDTLEGALTEHESSVASVSQDLNLVDGTDALGALDLSGQEDLLSTWAERFDELRAIVVFNRIRSEAEEAGLGSLVDLAQRYGGIDLLTVFRATYFEGLLSRAIGERPALADFERVSHERMLERFRELDATNIRSARPHVALTHYTGVPRHEAGGQLAVLTRELNKKRRHLPIRQLIQRAGNAVQAIKPVFMMSPLSIATYIAPGSVEFDLVVFDEASQVRPVEALGAIARGLQTVVVGDDRQLPPTRFFDAAVDDEDEESATGDLESVLGLFKAQNMPSRMLRWHYRSRHESLITVSNHEFYESRLTLFPSPDRSGEELGLRYNYLPETVYDRGGSRSNTAEAASVAGAVMRHAKARPHLTLGVVAFSSSQAQAIEDQLELLRRRDPSCETFFAAHPFEPFFVKSLENVQGDERDVMFVSVGYGRDARGAISMSFGPLNQDGGERRLNVLITRSRLRCEVFTNLLPDDIDLSRTGARGVRALKTFLNYARNGQMDVPIASGRPPDSPFEEAVRDRLVRLGYRVDTQVGSAGYFVDLAVVDPERPGRYLLGIECDGATYHSARSARDRDRLRQEILQNLGWRIHRIWSTDWFRDADREVERAVETIERVRLYAPQAGDEGALEGAAEASGPVVRVDDEVDDASDLLAYEVTDLGAETNYYFGNLELHQVSRHTLADWVAEVASGESPVHIDDVMKRITDVAEVNRAGRRIREAVEAGCHRAVHDGRVVRRGDFVWTVEMETAPLRDRSELPDSAKKAERIAPEELAAAVEMIVSRSYGIHRDEIAPAVLRLLLGFRRTTRSASDVVRVVVDEMISDGRLTEKDGYVAIGGP